MLSQTAGYPPTRKSYRIEARLFVVDMLSWSGSCFPKEDLAVENVLQQLGQMFSSDTLANDRSMVEMEGKGKDGTFGKWTDRLAQELHKPRRVRFQRRRVHVKGIDQIWSADLVDMSAFSKDNHGVKYLLTITIPNIYRDSRLSSTYESVPRLSFRERNPLQKCAHHSTCCRIFLSRVVAFL